MRWRRTGIRFRTWRRQDDGYLLLIALFVLVLTMTMASALAGAVMLRMERLERQHVNIQLTALLDGALAHAEAKLYVEPGWLGTGGAVPLGNGTYEVASRWVGNGRAEVQLNAVYGHYGRAAQGTIDTHSKRVVAWRPVPFVASR